MKSVPSKGRGTSKPLDAQRLKRAVSAWEISSPVLQEDRRKHIREASTVEAIQQLTDAFEAARRELGPRESSGLVEQQKYFKLLRK